MTKPGGTSLDSELTAAPSLAEGEPTSKPLPTPEPAPTSKPALTSARATWRRKALRLLVIVACTYLAVSVAIYFLQSHLIYFPSRHVEFTPKDVGMEFEALQVTASDGVSIAGWHVPCESSKGTVLFFHGNAGNLGDVLLDVQEWHRLEYAVVAVDYRGFGDSEGVPTETGVYEDAEAAWRYAVSQRDRSQREGFRQNNSQRDNSERDGSERNGSELDGSELDGSELDGSERSSSERDAKARRLIYHGRSLGGAVAIELARRHPPAALIVESTFTSLPDVGQAHYPLLPVRWLARHRYDSVSKVGELSCPKLFLHGRADTLIPISMGEQLFASAAEPKQLIRTGGDHTDGGMLYDSAVKLAVVRWLEAAIAP
ncbi:MAG: hypothetical protein IT449_06680 [Phycisphaerales bacterium]|nr:hypothetical protein [Phycisphaerales bacterium]